MLGLMSLHSHPLLTMSNDQGRTCDTQVMPSPIKCVGVLQMIYETGCVDAASCTHSIQIVETEFPYNTSSNTTAHLKNHNLNITLV